MDNYCKSLIVYVGFFYVCYSLSKKILDRNQAVKLREARNRQLTKVFPLFRVTNEGHEIERERKNTH